jgi:hypothetical protein
MDSAATASVEQGMMGASNHIFDRSYCTDCLTA